MERVLLQKVIKLNKARKNRKRWKQVVRVLAAVVVFCTTYALILPAITMEQDMTCGIEAHVHDASCYTEELLCTAEEQAGHVHSETCYTVSETPVCDEAESAHMHDAGCYGEPKLICPMTESEGHKHSSECMQIETVLSCTEEESEVHSHSEDCYTEKEVLVCTLSEAAPHTHEDTCYEKPLICGLEQAHVHTDACFRMLTCKEEESAGHSHSADCPKEAVRKLVCTKEEHTHDETCCVMQGGPAPPEFLCGFGQHTHHEACFDAEGVLSCSIPEHTHNADCTSAEHLPDSLTPDGERTKLCYQGEDYTIDVEFGPEANIPADAVLSVREIEEGTQEYRDYLDQTILAVSDPEQPDAQQISFARFFDISFMVNGVKVEPAAPVQITVQYEDTVTSTDSNTGVAVHFAEDGVEVLEAEMSRKAEETSEETFEKDAADTFVFTQDSFSVTGTVVMNTRESIDLSGAVQMIDYNTSITVCDALGVQTSKLADGDTFKIILEDTVYNYQFTNGKPVTLYLTLDKTLQMKEFICSDVVSAAQIDGSGNAFVLQIPAPTNGQDVRYRAELIGTAVNQTGGVANVNLRWDVSVSVFGKRQQFAYVDGDGNKTIVDLMGSSYSPETHELVVEKVDAASYADMIRQYANDRYKREANGENAVFEVYLRSKSDPNQRVSIPTPYSLKMLFEKSPVTVGPAGAAAIIDFTNGGASPPENASADLTGNTVSRVSVSGNNSALRRFAIAPLAALSPGTTGSGYTLSYNETADAFLKDPAYSAFYNNNSPIGTAGSFHIVAFDTANLGTHTNGNILAKNLYAGSNFGTNNYPYELTYVQNYLQVNPNSASNADHVLVIGSSNELGLYDNGNKYTINGQSIDRPKNIVQDVDTAAAPFIDLSRVRAEIGQIASDLVTYSDSNLQVTIMDQKNVIALTDPDAVGILNVTPADSDVFGKSYIQLSGFESGHNGSIVINVDCTGYTQIDLPKALVVVDGVEQGTSEVVEFSAGKVLWNFVNAEGVTINTHLMTGMVIAPGATVNINQNLNGTVVADNVNVKAESHRTDFTGKIVPSGKKDEYSVTIRKIKSGYVGTTLSGAQFELYAWSGSAWDKVPTTKIITDTSGLYQLPELMPDVAYKLVETQAPAGYLLAEEPYCFWIRESGTAALPTLRPSDYVGDPVDPGGIIYVPNEPDTHVETTEIELEKKWATAQTLTIKRVEMNLYQIAWRDGMEISRGVYKKLTLTAVMNWKHTVTDLPLSGTDSNGNAVTYTYTVEEVPITGFSPTYTGTSASGITTGKITVTNTQTGDGYVLPETGGRGTQLYTFSGAALVALALMYIVILKQKQRREAQKSRP